MKEELKKIFLDLSNKKLSEKEALEKIKAVKLAFNTTNETTVYASPKWNPVSLTDNSENGAAHFTQHHILIIHSEGKEYQFDKTIQGSQSFNIRIENTEQDKAYNELAVSCFRKIKEILSSKIQGNVLVQVVTNIKEECFEGVAAILKTATLENHAVKGQFIQIDEFSSEEIIAKQLLQEATYFEDVQIKYEDGIRYVKRLQEVILPKAVRYTPFKEQGIYLITGGFGGLGILFANEILEQAKSATVILTGRSSLNAAKRAVLEKYNSQGKKLDYVQMDVANEEEVQATFKELKGGYKNINGIIHAAGIHKDNFIIKKSAHEFEEVLKAKVSGTFNLDKASKELELDFLALFSSVAGWFGNPGQSDYAAGNAFMDQFSHYRNNLVSKGERSGKTIAFNWQLWEEGGMLIANEIKEQLFTETGIKPLSTVTGIHLFNECLNLSLSQILAVQGNVIQIKEAFFKQQKAAIPHRIENVEEIENSNESTEVFSSEKLFELTINFLKDEFSKIIKLPAQEIEPQMALEKYGIDSILAMNLTGQLEKTFGRLSKTLFFEYQTIHELGAYFVAEFKELLSQQFGAKKNKVVQPSKPKEAVVNMTKNGLAKKKIRPSYKEVNNNSIEEKKSPNNEPIAIIGLSGRYPESDTVQQYWENLKKGKDCIVEVPKDRWDWEEFYSADRTEPNRHYSKWGGFISGVYEFDPRFFNISPREARNIDPQERLFLQHSWMAMEDAGYTRDSIQKEDNGYLSGQVGVYVGVMYGEYNLSGSLASIANRVSYVLNLHGPSITLDTMCSSSLTSIHLACQDLKAGRTNLAIAGGVNVSVDQSKYQMLSTGQFISSDGHCQSFGEGGDGYIPGEGVGVVILKRLSEAEKDGDHIYGIIKGSALNHGGKTNGYSVPNPKAQASVISRALNESNTNPRHVSYLEAHGTGTKLGDPIEITALNKAFNQANEKHFCLLGSAKSNIGHCESAAGIAGVTKILLQLKYRQVVPSLHSEKLNPHIDFEHTPFVVNQVLQSWENPIIDGQKVPLTAGISSFGAGGANAHIIIEEYPNRRKTKYIHTPNEEVIIVLSARTESQLQEKAQDLLTFIKQQKEELLELDLLEMAYTLQVGREAMEVRLSAVVPSIAELENVLRGYVTGNIHSLYTGSIKEHKALVLDFKSTGTFQETVKAWIAQKNYKELAQWFARGLDIAWNNLYTEKPQRISLPAYPFAKEQYKLEPSERGRAGVQEVSSVIHPLVHVNTSSIQQTGFSSIFTGKEWFVKDYKLNRNNTEEKAVPFMATIEMVRVALVTGFPAKNQHEILRLTNINFGKLLLPQANKPVHIHLFSRNENSVAYEISSGKNIYVQGEANYIETPVLEQLNLSELTHKLSETVIEGTSFYENTKGNKVNYGEGYQVIQRIYRRNQELLAKIEVPENSSFTVHPGILEGVIQAASMLFANLEEYPKNSILPSSIDAVKLLAECPKEVYAWVYFNRQSEREITKLNIDVCDKNGTICLQLEGVNYHHGVTENTTQKSIAKVAVKPDTLKTLETEKKEILFNIPVKESLVAAAITNSFSVGSLEKPTSITLAALNQDNKIIPAGRISKKKQIKLQGANSQILRSKTVQKIHLYRNLNGIYELKITPFHQEEITIKDWITQCVSALNKVQEAADCKVLRLEGLEYVSEHSNIEFYNEGIHQQLFKTLANFPYPVIANMKNKVQGVAFLLGAICDFMVCSEEGSYKYIGITEERYVSNEERAFFKERFGALLTNDFLESSKTISSTGIDLKNKGWTMPVVSVNKIDETLQELAENLVQKSQLSLQLLKQHLARYIQEKVQAFTVVSKIQKAKKATVSNKIEYPKSSYYHIEITENGIAVITLKEIKEEKATEFASEIQQLFAVINKTKNHKPLVLVSENEDFLPERISSKAIADVAATLLKSKSPVISVLNQGAKTKGWLASLYSAEVLYAENATYKAQGILELPELAKQANAVFTYKFGSYISREILLTENNLTGLQLQERTKNIKVGKADDLLQKAITLANEWAKQPDEVVKRKQEDFAKDITEKLQSLPDWNPEKTDINSEAKVGVINLASSVVKAIAHQEGILEIRLESKASKNMFTDAFMAGVTEVFQHIGSNTFYKAVVISGYDNYFASGGTKEGLVAIQEGKSKFTDTNIYQLAMECKIPVIAAMQGHGVGAGWALGMFADFIIFGKERKYRSPYMEYGFTPGAGATFIFPETMGYDIARETLFTANEYSGKELKEKGTCFLVTGKEEVVAIAMQLAKDLAKNSREVLVTFKEQYAQKLLEEAEITKQLELVMHEKTFVGDEKTLAQIQDKFFKKEAPLTNKLADATHHGIVSTINVIEVIRKFLAQELQLEEAEIEDDAQFVDIGLDSITGVTWIRKINQHFNTQLEATQIYSYSTLNALSKFIEEQLGTIPVTEEVARPITENRKIVSKNKEERSVASITAKLKLFLAQELHLEEAEIEEEAQFVDIGLDSITGVTWIRKINQHFKTTIEATQIYNYPSIAKLGAFIKQELDALGVHIEEAQFDVEETIESAESVVSTQVEGSPIFIERELISFREQPATGLKTKKRKEVHSQAIAVVGMAGQFPEARNKEEFWDNIAAGKYCIKEVPKERWDVNTYYTEGTPVTGKTNSKWLGSVEGYDEFDPTFFTISPIEAESMDPQQRLFLQSCWHSIEDAGYNPKSLSGSKCGVFVGCATGDYQLASREHQLSAQGFTGGTSSILAARISYYLNLQGPCIALDTACSSSLVAIANACDSLLLGGSDVALAGGVYIMTGPEMHIKTAQSGMLSKDGKCHTFDQNANGFVPGEGVGVVMLKRLEDAERDNDTIYGVIQGWGVNQDGRTNGITAPNSESQTALEQEVYERFEINPEHIQLIEAHGTGTKLGDPIEVEALKKSFGKFTKQKEYCAIGSVKSNIGHCLTAAGVAGFMKVLMAMQHKQLPPTINYQTLNEHISLADSPFYVNNTLNNWDVQEGITRHAAISAFGFSGTNAHLVLSEYIPQSSVKENISVITQNHKYLLPLSAKNPSQLKEMLENLLAYTHKNKAAIDIIEMAYTLQTGREAMEERVVFMVASIEELINKIEAYLEGIETINDVFHGQVKRHKEGLRLVSSDDEMKELIIKKWLTDRRLGKLADLWSKGLDIDWDILYPTNKPQRMRLPVYPFAKEKYWIEPTTSFQSLPSQELVKEHPLLHKNTASLKEQGYIDTRQNSEAEANDKKGNKFRKIERINLPTYPFAQEQCWPDIKPSFKQEEKEPALVTVDLDSIENVIHQIDAELIDTEEAIYLLKELT